VSALRMPVVFLGHGSPDVRDRDNRFRTGMVRPRAAPPTAFRVVCVSAHWETSGLAVTAAERPGTIHDFGGSSRQLYEVQYPAPAIRGSRKRVAALVRSQPVRQDGTRGLDHGAWSVLRSCFPTQDVPVVQLSLDSSRPGADHLRVGRELAPLRDEGVLVLGSGNVGTTSHPRLAERHRVRVGAENRGRGEAAPARREARSARGLPRPGPAAAGDSHARALPSAAGGTWERRMPANACPSSTTRRWMGAMSMLSVVIGQ